MGHAAQSGNIRNMEWLKAQGCPFTTRTFSQAAQGNINYHSGFKVINFVDIRVLEWLKENNCPWDEETFASAVENGNLENMKWLKSNNCPWDNYTFDDAAENGCPWSANTFASAADYYGILDNMKWLKDNGCPYDEWAWVTATRSDLSVEKIIEILEYLKSINCFWERLTFEHESDHAFDPLIRQWLFSNGYEYHMW